MKFHPKASTKLRADRVIVKKISPEKSINYFGYDWDNCECYSFYDQEYKYYVGKEHAPKENFNNDVSRNDASGIHFYLQKKKPMNIDFEKKI